MTIATGVSAWADQSGGSLIASVTQATGSAQPTVTQATSTFGNRPTLTFNSAASQSLSAASLSLALPFTWIFVGSQTGGGGSFMGTSDAGLTSLYSNAGNVVTVFDGANVATSVASNVPFIAAAVLTATTCTIYVNSSAATAASSGVTGHAMTGNFFVGASNGGLGIGTLPGTVAEVAIYNSALSAQSIGQLFRYAGKRYSQTWS